MKEGEEIKIALKFAEIDNKPYAEEHEGWVSSLAKILQQTLGFYFHQPVVVYFKNETEELSEEELKSLDVILYILSPAFLFSSNLAADVSLAEKVFAFNTASINAKIYKLLKGPVNVRELPMSISMGSFHYFYQNSSSGDSAYETLFDWDSSAKVRSRYWESFTNLLFELLKNLKHKKSGQLMPENEQTVFLGAGDIAQLWNRINLFGELNSRGIKVLPDQDYSIEVNYLNDPTKFYLEKSNLAIHFPEEFLPLDKTKLQKLAELKQLKRFIWFDPDVEKELEKKKQYDELKQKLKNLDHVEAISSGLEELKEIIFSGTSGKGDLSEGAASTAKTILYLITSDRFEEALKERIVQSLERLDVKVIQSGQGAVNEKRAKHYQHLKESHFCLICYDGENPEWLRANVNEVKKSVGLHLEKSQQIKLGIIAGKEAVSADLKISATSCTLISALSASLEEDLNDYVYEK